MRFPIIPDGTLSPVAAAEAVVRWHTENYDYDKQNMLAELAIDLHTQLRNLVDDNDPQQIGSWHLLASLVDYTKANGVDFDDLVKDVSEYSETHPGPRVDKYAARGGRGLDDEGKPAELGTWHLMATLANYLGLANFREIAAEARADVEAHPSPAAGMTP